MCNPFNLMSVETLNYPPAVHVWSMEHFTLLTGCQAYLTEKVNYLPDTTVADSVRKVN